MRAQCIEGGCVCDHLFWCRNWAGDKGCVIGCVIRGVIGCYVCICVYVCDHLFWCRNWAGDKGHV